jgi:uncharacterized membrane protein YwzB
VFWSVQNFNLDQFYAREGAEFQSFEVKFVMVISEGKIHNN